MPTDFGQFSEQLALKRGVKFLNHAGTSPITRAAAQAMHAVIDQAQEPMDRHLAAWIGIVEQARRQAANLLHASTDEIAFVQNTSSGLSLIAHMVPFRRGDVILYDEDDFPSNRFIWDCVGRRPELELRSLPYARRPGEDLVETLSKLDLSRARLLSISLVSYRTGYRHDLKAIGEFCRQLGIYLCVDAIQAVGAVDLDLSSLEEVCFLSCGGQKWLHGPVGSGFIFIRKRLVDELNMPMAGWASVDKAGYFQASNAKWLDGAPRFEAGLPDIAAIAGLGRNLELYNEIGIGRISAGVARQALALRRALEELPLRTLNQLQGERPSGIVSFELDSREKAEAIDATLKKKCIVLTRRNSYFRLSPHFHTEPRHLEQTVEVFSHFLKDRTTKGTPANSPKAAAVRREGCAVVVGAAGGLGQALAEELAKRGFDLFLTARDDVALRDLSLRLQRLYSVKVETTTADLTDRESVEKLRQALASRERELFVYAAAAATAAKVLEERESSERETFDVNYFTPVTLTKSILSAMLKLGRGRVLLIATSGSRNPVPLFSSYAASKCALWTWAEGLAGELKGSSVSCTVGVPPRMSSATQQKLARTALRHYTTEDAGEMSYPSRVAEQLLDATFAGAAVAAPLGTRVLHAVNSLFPGFVRARMSARYAS